MTNQLQPFDFNEELVTFASEFAKNYKILTANHGGTVYTSNKRIYQIIYFDVINNGDSEVDTPARIGHLTGIINLAKNKLLHEDITEDLVFFLILWLVVKNEVAKGIDNETSTTISIDNIVTQYYLTTGRSKRDIITGFYKLYDPANISMVKTKERMDNLITLLTAHGNSGE